MKRLLLLLAALLVQPAVQAAGGGAGAYQFTPDLTDQKALQRGARTFVNYCLGCHSAAYMRYNRMGRDLGIPDSVLLENFMFGSDKVGDTMTVAMSKEEAVGYFGIAPPDLSVTARARGAEWLYNYLMSFYLDPSKPTGVNNLVFPDVAMPHVLWDLQGWQTPVYTETTGEDGLPVRHVESLELTIPPDEKPAVYRDESYEQTVADLVNFMVYLGEPIKMQRYSLGLWVLVYLFFLLIIMYFLKREYWKDVH